MFQLRHTGSTLKGRFEVTRWMPGVARKLTKSIPSPHTQHVAIARLSMNIITSHHAGQPQRVRSKAVVERSLSEAKRSGAAAEVILNRMTPQPRPMADRSWRPASSRPDSVSRGTEPMSSQAACLDIKTGRPSGHEPRRGLVHNVETINQYARNNDASR